MPLSHCHTHNELPCLEPLLTMTTTGPPCADRVLLRRCDLLGSSCSIRELSCSGSSKSCRQRYAGSDNNCGVQLIVNKESVQVCLMSMHAHLHVPADSQCRVATCDMLMGLTKPAHGSWSCSSLPHSSTHLMLRHGLQRCMIQTCTLCCLLTRASRSNMTMLLELSVAS